MEIRHLGKVIEFEEPYRPNSIMVDGVPMTMDLYAERHGGKNWRASSHGNILMYEAEDGSGIDVPQKKFQEAKEKQSEHINVRIAPSVKQMAEEMAREEARSVSNLISKLIVDAYGARK